MDSNNKDKSKNRAAASNISYNPWNLLFSPRNRTESENSVNSNTSTTSASQFGGLQRQTSKTNEEYLWMM
ncbi:hypothetical protein O3G_MSEX013195 [Manduca sexta]|nr:hypothetical protein O3G_MSEX013195 [Manduca sexta]